ncbi:hypothetical protein [Steroidobacter agaridevorans]|uniref:hypothetical protein n=1 Tax=Steroidobacter agaridevorans TaxID=2695856 RepID=UPI0013255EE5|nr:hypothetical protein [Steroidobacter agaridevorans]GFE87441.1 hypothetical protein GCM10011488_23950 [Steroidobacter agaridevorans]
MQNQARGRSRSRIDRLSLIDEDDTPSSPSYFEWRERTIRTQAYRPEPKPQPKVNSLIRLFRRFG